MVKLKTAEEIELIRQSALVVSKTLGMIAKEIKPGAVPKKLDKLAEEFIRDQGAEPGFLGLYGCPSTLLISTNEVVVHGLPVETPLKEGDIVSVDCGAFMNGYYGDHAYTFCVGEIDPATKKLVDTTLECLYKGIAEAHKGKRIGDLAFAIQNHAETNGFSVVRELVGHGLGKELHEKPEVPNFGKRGRGTTFKDGMTLAVEPMINMGVKEVKQLADGWTIATADGKPSAHFEHDIAIINGQPEILSTFKYVEEALGLPLTV